MGKVKKIRQKYHLSIKKSKSLNNLPEVSERKNEGLFSNNSFKSSGDNIFAGVDISWDDINKTLPKDLDVRSVISSKSRKELKEVERHLKKKDKIKLRHERFLQKLDITHQLLKNSKSKKKKQKKDSGNDMSALLEALPTWQSLDSSRSDKLHEKPKSKIKGILKSKQRLRQQTLDARIFKSILNDETFKKNPFQAVNQYLKQKVAKDA